MVKSKSPKTRSGRSYGAYVRDKSTSRGRSTSLKKRMDPITAAATAGTVADAVRRVANAYTSTREAMDYGSGNSKVSYFKGTSTLAGKIGKSQKQVKRNMYSKKKKGLSKYGMSQLGITYREEQRLQDIGTDNNESRLIGHYSLPVAATYYNVFRSLLKALALKAGIHVESLTATHGFSGNQIPQIVFFYYKTWTDADLESKLYAPDPLPTTWQTWADGLADWFLTQFTEDPRAMRWLAVELRPATTYNQLNTSKVRINLPQSKIIIRSKSCLKFQNQSGTYATASTVITSDDVNNVPVEASMYYVKGNKFIHQNRKVSGTDAFGGLGFSNTYTINQVGAEPCPAYEIINCTGKSKINMDPGHIKTSIISYSNSMSFGSYIRMLCKRIPSQTAAGWSLNTTEYMANIGHARGIHVDRVVGLLAGAVRLLVEVELTQQIACQLKKDTSTDQYEVQRPTS